MKRFWVAQLGRYLLTHPRDVASVVRASWRLRRADWWRSRPWLPVPPEAYWNFRMSTVNGTDGVVHPRDVVAAAKWSDAQDVRR